MKTTAVRIHGKKDLRLESFELPEIKETEILAKIISDSICMSSYKAAIQGTDHKRVHNDIAEKPAMIGHEFCGVLVKVGSKWADKYHEGNKFVIQPALNYNGSLDAPGYSYQYIGGDATYIIIPEEVMLMDCLLPYSDESWFNGSLTEPISCVVGAFNASYHTVRGKYEHKMGIKKGGRLAILAGAGPMGLAATDYALHCDRKPSVIVVTDVNQARLDRAKALISPEEAEKEGVKLFFVNTSRVFNADEYLKDLAGGDFDDAFVFAPFSSLVETADRLLGQDGCLNFFAGPTDSQFSAPFNFYNVHYASTHIVGTSGGNTDDMLKGIEMIRDGKLTPSMLVTHIGGLDCVIDTTLNLPRIPGGKKLIYTEISLPLTAIEDFEELGKTDPMFAELAKLVSETKGLWNVKAEKYLLEHAAPISI